MRRSTQSIKIPPSRITGVGDSDGLQWPLELGCGHKILITRMGRPTRKTIVCPKCLERARKERAR